MFSLDQSVAGPKHLYSTHTFNSREQVKELLHKHLAQVCYMHSGYAVFFLRVHCQTLRQ